MKGNRPGRRQAKARAAPQRLNNKSGGERQLKSEKSLSNTSLFMNTDWGSLQDPQLLKSRPSWNLATVRFDIGYKDGGEDGQEDGWTEESASCGFLERSATTVVGEDQRPANSSSTKSIKHEAAQQKPQKGRGAAGQKKMAPRRNVASASLHIGLSGSQPH